MGVILSKFRRAKPSLEDRLEKIDKELTEIRRFTIDTEVEQKRIIGRLSIFGVAFYALAILIYYIFIQTESFTWGQYSLSLLPFVVFPFLVWGLRRTFAWWYQRKIVMNKENSDSLRKERERLLDEVMDTETFKVAKKILEKYAPSHLLPKYLADQQRAALSLSSTPLTRGQGQGQGADLRRRTIGGASVSPQGMGMGMRPGFGPNQSFSGPGMGMRPQFRPMAIMGAPGMMNTPGNFRGPRPSLPSLPSGRTGFTPTRYMLPQAPSAPVIHNRKTGWLDTLVDKLVGDGPTHRYALICRYCATHNGLATPDDFPFTGYRCVYCRQFNPPKQQRPSAQTLPRNTVLIEEMDSTLKDADASNVSAISETEIDSEAEPCNDNGNEQVEAGAEAEAEAETEPSSKNEEENENENPPETEMETEKSVQEEKPLENEENSGSDKNAPLSFIDEEEK